MILFKRLGESFRHIEDREWLLLALETLGVLAGILLAYELQEWASRRSDAAKRHQLMERFFEESEQDVAAARYGRDRMHRLVQKEVAFATLLSQGKCPPDGVWDAVDTVGMYPTLRAPRAVYEELMGAGGLSSIDNAAVRKSVALFNMNFDWAQGQNEFFRTNIEPPVAMDDPRSVLSYDPSADEPEIARYDHRALCSDRRFRNRMVSATRNHSVIARLHGEATDSAIAMCTSLGWAIGHACHPAFGGELAPADLKVVKASLAELRGSRR